MLTAVDAKIGDILHVAYMPKDDEVAIRVFMPPSLRNSFKSLCVKEGITMNEVILDFVQNYVAEREPPAKKNG